MVPQNGTQLIELMITVSILAILALVALPIYSQYQEQAYRLQAQVELKKVASALENYFLRNNTYENVSLANLQIEEQLKAYRLIINSATRDSYVISANAVRPIKSCRTLTLNSNNETFPKNCW